MNFYKELNKLEQQYSGNPEIERCMTEMTRFFCQYLNFLVGQLTKHQQEPTVLNSKTAKENNYGIK